MFYNQEKAIRTYVHGNGYVSAGMPEALKWIRSKLERKHTVKTPTLGPGKDNQEQIQILNRIVTRSNKNGLEYEADPKHIEIIQKQLAMTDAKTVATPGTKDEGRTKEDNGVELGERGATMCSALVTRCNHLSPDRPNIPFSVEELARAMYKPTIGDLQELKRLARYLNGATEINPTIQMANQTICRNHVQRCRLGRLS